MFIRERSRTGKKLVITGGAIQGVDGKEQKCRQGRKDDTSALGIRKRCS